MQRRELGNSGLRVSAIGFVAWAPPGQGFLAFAALDMRGAPLSGALDAAIVR